jgi:zinc D-Ala-D-Ala carboxypeptidase
VEIVHKKPFLGSVLFLFLVTGCARSNIDIPFLKNTFQNNDNGQAVEEITKQENKPKPTDIQEETSSNELSENQITLEDIFFNQLEEVDGKQIIQNPENTMALVNKQFGLPESFLPNDLVRPNVNFSFGNLEIEKSMMRKEAADALEEMFAEARENGIELYAVSGYRSYEYQDTLFQAEVNKVGKEKAVEAVAFPGQSEHQTGLAMDISSKGEGLLLTESFGSTQEGKWLAENAHRFGYILRYPKGKESITGYQYESWHFRYIGKEPAKIIFENNWTLEEYFQVVKKI